MADFNSLTADELISELKRHGLKAGPITPTTRKLFENKLARARGQEKRVLECEEICSITSSKEEKTADITDSCSISNESILNTSTNNFTGFHYGVSFNRCNSDGSMNTKPAVFGSQQQALQAVKQLKGKCARFNSFKTREEAERFSLSSLSSTPSSPAPVQKPVDPVGNFKKPSPQELIKFRKIIEAGNFQEFLSIVNNNPKYLISSGDTPVVLQEGFRYNAMHIAAKENKPGICKLIADTVESDKFWIHYLSLDKDFKRSPMNYKRKQFLADLYLNTPDKGNFETPLHFACKFGHVDVAKYLVSHPLTNSSPRNKYGETPEQIICSRCSSQTGSVKIMDEIKHVLEDNHYVPVFGSEGDASPPSIGEPWSPDMHSRGYRPHSNSQSPVQSPVDPKMTVRAYAGPMSPSKAKEFHRHWKTPPGSLEEKRKYKDIRRGDSTRGLERIGRSLAHAQNIPWTEYWSFLDAYVDLSQPSGLERLEEYFKGQFSKLEATRSRSDQQDLLSTPITSNRRHQESSRFSTPVRMMSNSSSVFMHEGTNDHISIHDSPSFYPVSSGNNLPFVSNTINTTCEQLNQLTLEPAPLINRLNQSFQLPLATDKVDQPENNLDKVVTVKEIFPPLHRHSQSPRRIKSAEDENVLFLCQTNLLDQLKEMSIEDDMKTRLDNDGVCNKEDQEEEKQQNLQQPDQQQQQQQQQPQQHEQQQHHQKQQNLKQPDQQHPDQQHEQQQHHQKQQNLKQPDQQQPDQQHEQQQHHQKQHNLKQPDQQQQQPQHPQKHQQHHEQQQPQLQHHVQQHQPQQQLNHQQDHCDSFSIRTMSDELQTSLLDRKSSTDNTDNVFHSRKETKALFINGCYPTKTDLDVLRALEGVPLSYDSYPLVTQWRDRVTSHTSNTRDSWPSPGSPLCRYKSLCSYTSRFTTSC